MNLTEARTILEFYRPGQGNQDDPRLAAALKYAEQDPALAQWLAARQRFDGLMTSGVKAIPVPADLKASILAQRNIVTVPFWARPLSSDWRLRAAAAAIVLGLGALGGLFFIREPAQFADFRHDLIANDWAGDPHLELESSDPQRIQTWLAAQKGITSFAIPRGLQSWHIEGCRVIERDGAAVPMLCFVDGPRHMHLFVVKRTDFPDLPPLGAPDFEQCGQWKTASWRQGDTSYVLTGLRYQSFVSKFRKAGRWTMSG